jgi:D-aminopeptidase
MIGGVPVGAQLRENAHFTGGENPFTAESGSLIVVLATDAPLLPHQLRRIAKRATIGMARTGGLGGNGSGDIFLAFSTANADTMVSEPAGILALEALSNDHLDPLLYSSAYATEEAIVNSLIAAETMRGRDGLTIEALPQERLIALMRERGAIERR